MNAISIRKTTSALAVLAVTASFAHAVPVTITNHSFESNASGWTQVGGGIKTPPQDNLGAAPDGSKVYFTWTNGQHISQVLTATLAANTTYTLEMEHLTRTDSESPITAFLALGYGSNGPGGAGSVELASIVTGDAGAPALAAGTGEHKTWTLTFTTDAAPAGLGEALWIQLGSNPTVNDGSAGYDNVRLDASIVGGPDTTDPTITDKNPADNLTDVAVSSNLVATFSEDIALVNGGTITIRNLGPSPDPDEVITIPDAARVSVSGNELTINPAADLDTSNDYAVQISADAVEDLAASPNAFAGITDDVTWNFQTAASSSPITIVNPSFENGNSGWTQVGGGIKTPPQDNLGDAPDGDDVYFTWSNGQSISQVLTATLAANTTYTLEMDYLTRTDGEGPITAFLSLGYGAGGPSGGVELASIVNNDPGAPVPVTGSGSYTTWTLTYTTGASPAGLGEVLWIDLGANPTINNGSSGYDNLRLSSSASGPGGTDFSDWIAGYPGVGTETDLNNDPDGDGKDNGVENFFGTAPDTFTQGLISGMVSGGTFTFTHPQGTLADDLTATYQWSVDLDSFFADGVADGGVQVDFVATPDTPSPGTTTVVATVTGPIPDKLFVTVKVTQNP